MSLISKARKVTTLEHLAKIEPDDGVLVFDQSVNQLKLAPINIFDTIVGPQGLPGSVMPAASDAEVLAGVATDRAVTPAGLKTRTSTTVFTTGDPTGVTSSSAALQALVDTLTPAAVAGVPGMTIEFLPGTYKFTSTVTCNEKSIHFKGLGVGNPSNYAPSPGKGTTFQWAGATGGRMFQIFDCRHMHFSDILFLGSLANPPAELINFEQGGSIGANIRSTLTRCWFGDWSWSNPSTIGGTVLATTAVRFPSGVNNDTPHFSECTFSHVTTGVDIQGTQSVWGLLDHCRFENCTTGLKTLSTIDLATAAFGSCALNIDVYSSAQVRVFGMHSETDGKIARVNDGSGSLSIIGGFLLMWSTFVGPVMIEHLNLGGQGSMLHLADVYTLSQGTVVPKVKVIGTDAGLAGRFIIDKSCRGFYLANMDINTTAAAGVDVDVVLENGEIKRRIKGTVTNYTNLTNTAVGSGAQPSITTGVNNTAEGSEAQRVLTTGSNNTAIGSSSQYQLTTGGSNIAVGSFAQQAVTTGNNNTAIGSSSQTSLTAANNNVAIGSSVQAATTSGGDNVGIGTGPITLSDDVATRTMVDVSGITFGGALKHTGTSAGFYNTTPIVKQTGVAVTVAGVHAALVNLGLIS